MCYKSIKGMAPSQEMTFIMVKPDGVQRGLIHQVLKRFERRGFRLVALKMTKASPELLEQHYGDLCEKPFFGGLITYMSSGPIVCMVWEGSDVVRQSRKLLGETRPLDSNPATLRGDFCIDVGRNLVHGSDTIDNALKEINLWFSPEELCSWTPVCNSWIYES